jgi:tetratricopeptide (TPR) repeat protein
VNRIVPILLALVLLLCPIYAALPDDTTLMQTVWASALCVLVLIGALFPALKGRAVHKETPLKRATGTSSASPSSAPEGVSLWSSRPFRAGNSFAVLLALALCSLLARLLTHHNAAYLGQMLRGWGVLATEFALFLLCRSLARVSRGPVYLLIGAAVLGAAIISANGVDEYLLHFMAHESGWRVFANSTPDFLAGYLVLMLPVTLALFLGAPGEKRLPLLFGLIIVLQMATLLTTGSRFALVSLVVALAVFAGTLAYAARHGLALDSTLRRRLAGIAVVVALAGLAAAGPILRRLHSGASQDNSGAFRMWTWRGAAHMAAANPVLGAGVGTWIDTYPRYALTGFTRLAHNSYLQLADECGIPALLVFIATLGFVGVAGVKGLKRALPEAIPPTIEKPPLDFKTGRRQGVSTTKSVSPEPTSDLLSAVAPADDRLLLCGLLGSLAAGVVQNVIDSDWYVYFIGVTFWALAGLAVGISERATTDQPPSRDSHPWHWPLRVVAALPLVLFVTQGVAAWFGSHAQATIGNPDQARDDYETARSWDPLNARYPAELGARVLARTGDLSGAEEALRQAVRLEPGSTDFRRLGTVLDAAGKHDQAASAYQEGLRIDPNSLDLLLALAKDSPPDQALGVYRHVAVLEDSPVGKVRAIGEITEVKFAVADAALAASAGNPPEAALYARRAQKVIEAYIDEGGTLNGERQVQASGHADPAGDTEIRDLYAQVMATLAGTSPPDQRTALAARAADYGMRLQAIIAIGQGATAPTAAQAANDYDQASQTLERWITGTQSASIDAQGIAQMRDLYKQAMDSLIASTPAGQRSALRDREQTGLAKFAARFPTA